MNITPEPSWDKLLKDLLRNRGTSILLGETDSGKSSLARYLIEKLLSNNVRLSLIDADIGQSVLGLPATISMKTFDRMKDLDDFKPDTMSFIGVFNPAEKISFIIKIVKKMVDTSRSKDVHSIVIDTTGLIRGETGRTLKLGKIREIKPEHIIALQRKDELDHILPLVGGCQKHMIKPSPSVKKRRREDRIRYRKMKFREYFSGSDVITLFLRRLAFFYNESQFDTKRELIDQGTLIGVNKNEETLALGVFEELLSDSIVIKTPLTAPHGVNRIVVSDIAL